MWHTRQKSLCTKVTTSLSPQQLWDIPINSFNTRPHPGKTPTAACFKTHKLSPPTKLLQVPSNEERQEEQGDWDV